MTSWGFKGLGNRYLEIPSVGSLPPGISPPSRARLGFTSSIQASINAGAFGALATPPVVDAADIPSYRVSGGMLWRPARFPGTTLLPIGPVNPFNATTGTVTVSAVYIWTNEFISQDPTNKVTFTLYATDWDGAPALQITNTTDTNTINFDNPFTYDELTILNDTLDLSLGYRMFRMEVTQDGSGREAQPQVIVVCQYAE